jgi:hypothetical protein
VGLRECLGGHKSIRREGNARAIAAREMGAVHASAACIPAEMAEFGLAGGYQRALSHWGGSICKYFAGGALVRELDGGDQASLRIGASGAWHIDEQQMPRAGHIWLPRHNCARTISE